MLGVKRLIPTKELVVSRGFHYQYIRASSSRGRNDRVGDLKIFSLEPLKAHFSTLYLVMKRDG